jgi:xenotropic and polytropic retrovirus receptor 1
MVAGAYTQDFEKKRRPVAGDSDNISNRKRDDKYSDEEDAGPASSDGDDNELDAQDALDTEALLRE